MDPGVERSADRIRLFFFFFSHLFFGRFKYTLRCGIRTFNTAGWPDLEQWDDDDGPRNRGHELLLIWSLEWRMWMRVTIPAAPCLCAQVLYTNKRFYFMRNTRRCQPIIASSVDGLFWVLWKFPWNILNDSAEWPLFAIAVRFFINIHIQDCKCKEFSNIRIALQILQNLIITTRQSKTFFERPSSIKKNSICPSLYPSIIVETVFITRQQKKRCQKYFVL